MQTIWCWIGQAPWLWLVVSLAPYAIKRHRTQQAQTLSIQALCWQLALHWQDGHCSWELVICFIKRLRRK